MSTTAPKKTTGITIRHSRSCPARDGGVCARPCIPAFQAHVWAAREGKRIRKTFPTLAAAKAWRIDAMSALGKGTMRAPTRVTFREATEAWLAGANDGSIRNRSGHIYKPGVVKDYESALKRRLLPDLGGARLSDITRRDVQDLADRLIGEGLDASTVRNALMPLRAIFRRATARGDVMVNPTAGLELPAVTGKRDRVASPAEAARLLVALPATDRAVWATALYAGLRRGELMALRWGDVDLAGGVIRVERSWDPKTAQVVAPKSVNGTRRVPIPAVLRDVLIEHKMQTRSDGLVFGRTPELPFTSALRTRAVEAWKDAELEAIGMHECRHTFASLMIAAGVNAKSLSTYMGHASITITLDRYGHLMPGNEDEAADLLDAYLGRAVAGSGSAAPRELV